ncbi:MAG: MFS transporter [Armatimonadota bacterium]
MFKSGLFENPLRRRVILLLIVEFIWGMGIYFTLPATTIPSYLRSLGASPRMIGLTAMIITALPLLLQFYGRSVLDRFKDHQKGLVILHLIVITPYYIIPWMDSIFASTNPALLAWLVIGLLALSQVLLGLCIPVWIDMIAQVIPSPLRGRYFGLSTGAIAVGGIIGGGAQMYLQGWLGDSIFRGLFIASGICYTISMGAFYLTPIPKEAFNHPVEPSVFNSLKKGIRACHPKSNFARFAASSIMLALAMTIVPFLVVYATDAQKGLGLPSGIFTFMTFTQAIGGAVGALLLGWMVDHHGPRLPWICMISMITIVILVFPHAATSPIHASITIYPVLVLCSLLMGVLSSNWAVSAPAMLEFSPDGDKSSYIAVTNVLSFFPAALGPVVMASYITSHGYEYALHIALAAGIAAILFALTIRCKQRVQEQGTAFESIQELPVSE